MSGFTGAIWTWIGWTIALAVAFVLGWAAGSPNEWISWPASVLFVVLVFVLSIFTLRALLKNL